MRKVIIKFVIPLTIISFILFTKWWLVADVDGHQKLLYGFPFPFMTDGPTSLSFTFFILEFTVDIITYFIFWYWFFYFLNKWMQNFKFTKIFGAILWFFAIMFLVFSLMLWSENPNVYYFKKPNYLSFKILKTEWQFVGNDRKRRELLNDSGK